MGQANLSTKRKPSKKGDHPPKKPKVVTGPNIGETPAISKLPQKPGPRMGKGLMKGHVPIIEERPILFREDLSYALKQLSSIINDDDYSHLGNHTIEAMGETGLFSLAQVCLSVTILCPVILSSCCCLCFLQGVLMMKGLMDRCVSQEMVVACLKKKLSAKDTKVQELLAWKDVQIRKLDLTKQLLKESETQVEALNKILKDKEAEISEAKS